MAEGKLTKKQQAVFEYIERYIAKYDVTPTLLEMCGHFDWRSDNNARQHLQALERKGLITLRPGLARGIVLKRDKASRGRTGSAPQGQVRSLPIVGRVAAGMPIDAEENVEGHLSVDANAFSGAGMFALKVRGDSMLDAGILDGDLALIRESPTADPDDLVVASVDGESTLKRFTRKGRKIILKAENPDYPDIPIEPGKVADFRIVGKVVGVYRKY